MVTNRSPGAEPRRPVVIMGAGHQGRNIHDIFVVSGTEVLGFLDNTKTPGQTINGARVLGGFELARDAGLLSGAAFIVGLGDNRIRRELFRDIRQRGGALASAIHPAAAVSSFARLGEGIYIQAFSRVLANAGVGDFALIEGLTSIGSDVEIGEAAFVGPGAQLTAKARLGDGAFLGANAAVIGPAKVGAHAVIGAGAVVIDDIPDRVLAVGVPCRIKKALLDSDSSALGHFRPTGKSAPST